MVHFIGAGPGAEDLITLRGAALLKDADIVIYAGSLVNPALLGMCKEGVKLYDSAKLALSEVIQIIQEAEQDQKRDPAAADERCISIVRLHSGDPGLYGAIKEQIDALKALDIPYDVTPGVSSFNASAAALESEYTVAGVSQSVIITRMEGRTAVPERERLRLLASHGASMVIFLSMGLIREVQKELLEGGAYQEETPAAIVYKVTWKEERIFKCRLSELAQTAEANGITKTALIIVGDFLGNQYEKSRLYAEDFTTEYRKGNRTGGIRMIAFTDQGEETAQIIKNEVGSVTLTRGGGELSLDTWVRENFYEAEALVFVGATGIAVRAVAPYIRSKAYDPAVIVVDEKGEHIIPLLSGHLGGANALALKLAAITGGTAVITTATDLNGKFAVDTWAKEQDLAVINPSYIKVISAAVLQDETIYFEKTRFTPDMKESAAKGLNIGAKYEIIDAESEKKPSIRIDIQDTDKECLKLCPQTGFLGIGCKRGATQEQIEEAFRSFLKKNRLFSACIQKAASIDLKREENGLLSFCAAHGFPVSFYSASELNGVPGTFSASDFVKETTGVDCVCERSAVRASGGKLYIRKFAQDGVTFALAL